LRYYEINDGEDRTVRIESWDKVYAFFYYEPEYDEWSQIASMLKSDYLVRLHSDVTWFNDWSLPWWPMHMIFQYEPAYLAWLVETKGEEE